MFHLQKNNSLVSANELSLDDGSTNIFDNNSNEDWLRKELLKLQNEKNDSRRLIIVSMIWNRCRTLELAHIALEHFSSQLPEQNTVKGFIDGLLAS